MTVGMTPESQWSPALSLPLAVCVLFRPPGCLDINLEPERAAGVRSFFKKVFFGLFFFLRFLLFFVFFFFFKLS